MKIYFSSSKFLQIKSSFILWGLLFFKFAICSSSSNEKLLTPLLAQGFGKTFYQINFKSRADATCPLGKSKLDFPLDPLRLGLKYESRNNRKFGFWVSGQVFVTPPYTKMIDEDWCGSDIYDTGSLKKFSYTESKSKLLAGELSFGLDLLNMSSYWRPLIFGLHLNIEHYRYKISGYDGWQWDPWDPAGSEQKIYGEAPDDVEVLLYDVSYLQAGFYFHKIWIRSFRWKYTTTFNISPLSFAIDNDDHVLRFKESRMIAFGIGFDFKNNFYLNLKSGSKIYLGSSLHYIRNWGNQSQEYYADEPTIPGDETGLKVDGIEGVLSRYTLIFSVGYQIEL